MGSNAATTLPTVELVSIAELTISPLNPRREKKLDPIELEQLAASIRANGILQPLLVRRVGKAVEVIAGRRRLEAARLAKLEHVPCIVRDHTEQEDTSAALVENEQRAQLRPLDSALAVASRLDAGESVEQVAVALGKPATWVARRANLTKLAPAVRKALEDPASEIRQWPLQILELLALLPEDVQGDHVRNARFRGIPGRQELLRELASSSTRLSAAPWEFDDAELVPKAGACASCPHNSANCQDLFGDLVLDEKKGGGAVCRLTSCWQEKLKAVTAAAAKAAQKEYGKDLLRVRGASSYGDALDVKDTRGQKGVLNDWEYSPVKKGAAGAKPALIVSGKGLGTVIHVKVGSQGSSSISRAKAPEEKKPEPGSKEAVKASTERLERRRMGWLVDEIRQRIEKAPAPKAEVVMKLASMFGVDGDRAGDCATGMLKKLFAAASTEKVWEDMRAGSLTSHLIRGFVGQLDGQHERALWLGQVLLGDAEVVKLEAAAIEAVPAPKLLGGLKQTPATKPVGTAKERKAAPAKRGRKV